MNKWASILSIFYVLQSYIVIMYMQILGYDPYLKVIPSFFKNVYNVHEIKFLF